MTKPKLPVFTKEEWIKKFEEVHGVGTYGYDRLPDKINIRLKNIEIYCPRHDKYFVTSVLAFSKIKVGCPECSHERRIINTENKIIDRRSFTNRSKMLFGDKFEYPELPRKFSLFDSIYIYCYRLEKLFMRVALDHIEGGSCRECKLERKCKELDALKSRKVIVNVKKEVVYGENIRVRVQNVWIESKHKNL